jgi:dTDP-4-amino-4,6-dideoxygalactose transaminase
VSLPAVPHGREHAWHRFTVRPGEDLSRDTVAAKLEAEGIQARV